MQRYILIRLVQGLFVLFVISIIVFVLTRASGDPTNLIIPIDADPKEREALREAWGLNDPIIVQFWSYLTNALQGDFGESTKFPGQNIMSLVVDRLLASFQLVGTALFIATMVAVGLGVLTAVRKDTPWDYGGKIFAFLGQSAPTFWTGIMLIWIFAVELDWFPTSGKGGFRHMVLPVVTLGAFQVAAIMRLVRSSMLDTLDSEYVKMARLKGLPEWKVLWKHCLRNAAIAPLTYFGITAGILLTGSVIVENIFAWPGVGQLVVSGAVGRDFKLVQGSVLIISVGFILLNLIVDILYAYVDPRIRYS